MKNILLFFLFLFISVNCFGGPIHDAAEKGDLEKVKQLISEDPKNIDAKCEEGYTPLHWALEEKRLEIVQYLIENGANVTIKTDEGGFTPLHMAAGYGYQKIFESLIEKGADVRAKTNNNFTPLHFASQNGHLGIVIHLIEKLKANIDIEAKASENITPLHLASQKGHLEVVKYLIEKAKANIETRTTKMLTPLHFAAQSGRYEIVQYLVEKVNANIEAKTKESLTPLETAFLSLWLLKRPESEIRTDLDKIKEIRNLLEKLLEELKQKRLRRGEKETPNIELLKELAQDNFFPIIRLLIANDADTTVKSIVNLIKRFKLKKTDSYETDLGLFFKVIIANLKKFKAIETLEMPKDFKVFGKKCLICFEAKMDVAPSCGHQFHKKCLRKNFVNDNFTCSLKCKKSIEKLFKVNKKIELPSSLKKQNLNKADKNDKTPLLHARENNNTEISKLLLPNGAQENGCANCSKKPPKMLRCSRCKKIQYCDRKCQKKHWNEHKKVCKPLQQSTNKKII